MVSSDTGVGTLARPNPWRKLVQDFSAIMGLVTGYGLDDKVLPSRKAPTHRARSNAPQTAPRDFKLRRFKAGDDLAARRAAFTRTGCGLQVPL